MASGNDAYKAPARHLPGGVYCAPWCGFKCKLEAHDQCHREARAMAEIMGAGWTPRVWENCGWNWSIQKGVAHLHPLRKGSSISGGWTIRGMTLFLNVNPQIVLSGEDPHDLLATAVAQARTHLEETEQALDDITMEG